MKLLQKLATIALMAAAIAGASLVAADEIAEEAPQVVVEANAEGLVVPAEMPEGIVKLTFDTQNSEAPILPIPGRLLPDVTPEMFMEAAMNAGPEAALMMVSLQGGTFIMPGQVKDVYYNFAPGEYVMLNFAAETPAMYWFVVVDDEGAGAEVELDAHVTVTLVDFAFGMPTIIPAGEHLWHIRNLGGQWHEIAITRIADDMTIQEAQAFATNPDNGGPDAPMPDFLWIPMNETEEAWLTVNLEPGTYLVGCFLPNVEDLHAGHEPSVHTQLGMVQVIVVQ